MELEKCPITKPSFEKAIVWCCFPSFTWHPL